MIDNQHTAEFDFQSALAPKIEALFIPAAITFICSVSVRTFYASPDE
jgi:hypothetical protein